MAFTSMVNSESLEDKDKFDASQERSKDDCDIYEAFDELFQDFFRLEKVNSDAFKKLHKIELERKSLISNLQEFTEILSKVRVANENLETKFKTLMSDLEKSNTQLLSFVGGSHKFDNLLELNRLVGNEKGL